MPGWTVNGQASPSLAISARVSMAEALPGRSAPPWISRIVQSASRSIVSALSLRIGPATFKMFYLASHDASSGIHGLIGARTLTVVPL